MHRFASILVLSFSATVFAPSVSRSDDSEDQLTVDQIVANWRQAVASIECVDAQFVRFEADLLAETMAVSKGCLAIDHGRRVAISCEPDDELAAELPKAINGRSFGLRSTQNERWIFDHHRIFVIDDNKQEVVCLELAQPLLMTVPQLRPFAVQPDKGLVENAFNLNRSTQAFFITSLQWIAPFDFPLENLPQLTEDLKTRFDIQIVEQTQSDVRLRMTPLRPFDRMSFQQIDVILSRESWLPEAVRFLDPPGTKTTTFVITKRRINECSEQMDDAFRVNLEQYQCHTIPRSVPTVSSSRSDGKP